MEKEKNFVNEIIDDFKVIAFSGTDAAKHYTYKCECVHCKAIKYLTTSELNKHNRTECTCKQGKNIELAYLVNFISKEDNTSLYIGYRTGDLLKKRLPEIMGSNTHLKPYRQKMEELIINVVIIPSSYVQTYRAYLVQEFNSKFNNFSSKIHYDKPYEGELNWVPAQEIVEQQKNGMIFSYNDYIKKPDVIVEEEKELSIPQQQPVESLLDTIFPQKSTNTEVEQELRKMIVPKTETFKERSLDNLHKQLKNLNKLLEKWGHETCSVVDEQKATLEFQSMIHEKNEYIRTIEAYDRINAYENKNIFVV